jgi:hypothetical protein
VAVVKCRLKLRRHGRQSGQTMVEYLMLLALAAVTSYLVVTGPVQNFTRLMVATIRSTIVNVVQNAELRPGEQIEPGEGDHPSAANRGKRLH